MGPLPLLAMAALLGALLPWHPPTVVAALAALGLAALGALLGRRALPGGALALTLAAFVAGGARRATLTAPAWPRIPAPEASLLRATVLDGCFADGDRDRCRVRDELHREGTLYTPRGRCEALPGDALEAVATARPVVPPRNPPHESPATVHALRGAHWRFDAALCTPVAREVTFSDHLRRAALRTRRRMARALDDALPPAHAARARALLFGDRAGIDAAEHDAFRETGMAHLLAVSGAHVSLLIALTGTLSLALLRRVPAVAVRGLAPRLARVIPLPLVGFFTLVTGEAPSSTRAWYTAALAALLSLVGRRPHHESLVAAVALLMVALDATLLADLGWQLSVIAAWSLSRGTRDEDAADHDRSNGFAQYLVRTLREALSASARVSLAVTPLLAWHFARAPCTALVMNTLAAPVGEALLLPSVLVAALVGALFPPCIAHTITAPVGALLGALFALPTLALRLPFASIETPSPTPAQWVIATAFVVALAARPWRAVWRGALVGVGVLLALEASHRSACTNRGALRITALDVGQGDAIVVELPDGAAMLVDAGGDLTGGPDPGATVVLPWLAQHRYARLAAVVLSHPHPDHAGGLPAVLSHVHADAFWDTGQGTSLALGGAYASTVATARARGVPIVGPSQLCGPPRWFHGAWIEVLSPCPRALDETPPNDASFVLRITVGRARALLPGDLEREGERALLGRLGHVDVLKVGHHGSRTSTTEALLDELTPRVAMVSAGHPSLFGHPHPTVVARLRARRIPLRRTDLDGAVTVTLHPDGRVE